MDKQIAEAKKAAQAKEDALYVTYIWLRGYAKVFNNYLKMNNMVKEYPTWTAKDLKGCYYES